MWKQLIVLSVIFCVINFLYIMLSPSAGKRHPNSNIVNFPNLLSQTGKVRRSLSVRGLFGGKKDNNDKGDEGNKVC